ncbi:hypothetical protein MCEMSEM23_02398 [Rhabdaerophilaceae bacterium]
MAEPVYVQGAPRIAILGIDSGRTSIDPMIVSTISNHREAEYLLMLDHSGIEAGAEWRAFLVEAMVCFLVWQRKPWGIITEADLDWLMGLVADAPSPSLPAILYALIREVNDAPERLVALALKHAEGRCAC